MDTLLQQADYSVQVGIFERPYARLVAVLGLRMLVIRVRVWEVRVRGRARARVMVSCACLVRVFPKRVKIPLHRACEDDRLLGSDECQMGVRWVSDGCQVGAWVNMRR